MIINTVITGGQGGGGDTVTALVGSNAGSVTVGDKVILNTPATVNMGYDTTGLSVGMPFYFDGNYLYATGGVYATDGEGGLTRLGNSGIYASMRDPKLYPPLFLPDNVVGIATLYSNGTVYMDFFESGLATGSTYQGTNNDFISDVRLDSSKTGFIIGTGDKNNTNAVMHVTGGGKDAYNGNYRNGASGQCIGFFDASGNPYCYYSNAIYSVTYNGTSTLVFTSLFTTSTVAGILSGTTYWKTMAIGDRVDNYQMWFEANKQIFGFTKLDIANSKIDAVATPTALQEITGTIRAAWWDLQNRLTIRTDVGLYVFSYTNHDLSTMVLVKKFEWASDYAGPATCSSDLNSYATGGYNGYLMVATDVPNGSYTYSANVYTGHNVASTSLTGIVSKAPYTDGSGNTVVDVDTILL